MATALYRRYRPESFADVIGQEHVTEPLMQALRTGRVNHAYLFSGPRGCGKTTSARILARCLNCEQGPTPTPCGVCDSCVALARGGPGSVDVIEIDAASHGGVDDARDLRERASYGPAQSRFKIYIIDEAHMVTPQGFNALLKIVEEPPEHVKFVFATTEPEKVIGTIRSRTHHYPFRLVPPQKLSAYMERLLVSEDVAVAPGVLSFVTRAGGGSVRDSLSVLDQLIAGSGPEGLTYDSAVSLLGFTDDELLDATVDALAAADGAATFRQVDRVIESGHDPRRFIEDLLERLRDLIIVAAVREGAGQVLRGVPEDQLERMRVQQAAFGPGALSRAADIANAGLTEMTGATAPRLQLELICARILLPAASGEQGYAARLDRLERRLEVGGVPSAAGGSVGSGARGAGPSGGQGSPGGQGAPGGQGGPGGQGAPAAQGQAVAQTAPTRTVSDYTPPSSAPSRAAAAPVVQRDGSWVSDSGGESLAAGGMGGGRSRDLSQIIGDAPSAPTSPSTTPSGTTSTSTTRSTSAQVPAESVGGPSVVETGVDSAGDVVEPAAAAAPGGLDTDALRRSWPEVLGRIFTMRRLTWTFVSQNAQVMGFDGRTLTLGIATAGLTTTFRAGNHAEVVRQALIDELGVDAVVDGVHLADVAQQPAVAPPAGAVPSEREPSPSSSPQQSPPPQEASSEQAPPPADPAGAQQNSTSGSWGEAGAGHQSRGSDRGGSPARGSSTAVDPGLSPMSPRSVQDNPGWGASTAVAPDWATGADTVTPTPPPPIGPAPAGEPSTAPTAAASPDHHARGASAVRQSFNAARSASSQRDSSGPGARTSRGDDRAPGAPTTDDSAVSDDDEDIEQSTDVGRPVVERVLGGRLVSETTD
ncbi:MAG: polymerase subunit gamma and tau [Humibacillus sp.]|nr:polymerase subunit gamma and tau [Humibacillus sp.]